MRILSLSILLFITLQLTAQFTYIEADLGYQYIRYRSNDDIVSFENKKIKTNLLAGNITGIWRPTRFIGAGLSLGFPITQKTKWGFSNTELSNGETLGGEDNTFSGDPSFTPTLYNYKLRHSPTFTFITRIFFKPEAKVSLDLRYTFFSVNEVFQFERSGAYATKINHDKKRSARGPGLSISFNFPMGDQFYLKYQYTVDFLKFDSNDSFQYDISQQLNSNHTETFARFKSPIEPTHRMHNWVLGLGYYF